jgi:hypothetical protein
MTNEERSTYDQLIKKLASHNERGTPDLTFWEYREMARLAKLDSLSEIWTGIRKFFGG